MDSQIANRLFWKGALVMRQHLQLPRTRHSRVRNSSRVLVATVAFCFIIVLSVTAHAGTAMPGDAQDMRGTWVGFFQVTGSSELVAVRWEITVQDGRRFVGALEAGDAMHSIEGIVAASGRVNLQGRAADSNRIGKLELHDFGGGAAVLNGHLMVHFTDGRMSDGTLLLLRSFAPPTHGDLAIPVGLYRGADYSDGLSFTLVPPPTGQQPPSFICFRPVGFICVRPVVVLSGKEHLFEGLATIHRDGTLIAIAQAPVGHLIFDAKGYASPDGYEPARITGRYTLELNDGTVHEGTFEAALETSGN